MRLSFLTGAALLATTLGSISCGSSVSAPQSVTYISTMSGANERPTANASTATATGTYVLTGNILTYTLTANGLSAAAIASHLHIGGAAVAGPVLVGYTTANTTSGTITSGSIDLSQTVGTGSTTITGDSLRVLLNNGNAYSNIHTSNFTGGEVRGQLIRQN